MIYENFVHQQSSPPANNEPSLTIGYDIDAQCACPDGVLNNVSVVKSIYANTLPKSALSKTLSTIDFSNVEYLEVYGSHLNFDDLQIISKMKLKFSSLFIKEDVNKSDKMKNILKAVISIPHLRIWYTGECHNPDDFAVYLVEWVLENGYIDSIVCTGRFLGEKFTFKSSKELSIHDTLDSARR
uniref:Uncharacterized protein n=1 Tax=Panagrolaimus sp. ES5 TaxID=591445 RepID=A0AC34F2R5_9BILA